MTQIAITGLIKITLPDHTIRLCDGGFFTYDGEQYSSSDDIFGIVSSVEGLTEGIGDEVPAMRIGFKPPGTSDPADLSKPGYQNARVIARTAEYNVETGAITQILSTEFIGILDQTTITRGKGVYDLDCVVVADGERLFQRNIGNGLTSAFHKSIFTGETGEDNATGLNRQVAWGVEAPINYSTSFNSFGPGAMFGGSGGSKI